MRCWSPGCRKGLPYGRPAISSPSFHTAARQDIDLDLVSVGSTIARAHHHAAGMRVAPQLLEEMGKALAEE